MSFLACAVEILPSIRMSWPVEKVELSTPKLQELVPSITAGLKANFKDVSVEVTDCPDLRRSPFHLAGEGLSGNERIADIGGPPNLSPTPKLDRKYSLIEIRKLMEMEDNKNNDDAGFDLKAAIDDLGSYLGTWDAEKEASALIAGE